MVAPRRYSSELRAEQARVTRARILEAFVAEARSGATEVSFPALAKRARVSVPTVNRYFPTRRDLLEAVVGEMDKRVAAPVPQELDDVYPYIRAFFRRQAELSKTFGALAESALTWQLRREVTVPRRRAFTEARVRAMLPDLAEPERTWLVDLIVVLLSSAMARTLQTYVDKTGDDAADRVEWALRAFLEKAERDTKRTANDKKGRKR